MITDRLSLGLQLLRIIVAFMVGGYAINECTQGFSSEKWPTVKGKVTSSTIKEVFTRSGTSHHEADIHYQYVVDGKTFKADRIIFGGANFRSPKELTEKFKADKPVEVHYKPGEPSVACLETGVNFTVLIPLVAFGGILAFMAFADMNKSMQPNSSIGPRPASNSSGLAQPKMQQVKGIILFTGLVAAIFGFKYGINAIHFGAIPGNAIAIVVLVGGGFLFVTFISLLPAAAGMLARARRFDLAEKVAKLNTKIASTMSAHSYETAVAYGLQAEIAQEQMKYPQALELSKKALNVLACRPKVDLAVNKFDDSTNRMIKESSIRYEKHYNDTESLCNESYGSILFDMGMYGDALTHAEKAKRLAQDNLRNAAASDLAGTKRALAGALALRGKIELAIGSPENAKSDLQESIRLRKEIPHQFEEYLAASMADLASAYCVQSEFRMAERTIEEGLKIVEGSNKPSHRLAKAKLRAQLADVKMGMGQLSNAESLLMESLDVREELLPAGHPEIAKTYLSMAKLRDLQGKQRDAIGYRRSAGEMLTNCFGPQYQAV